MAVDEKMQREVDIRRIVEEIVPYIINDPDRFIGSLIFDIYSGMEDVHFESISSVSQYIPNAHALSMKDMEFITPPRQQTTYCSERSASIAEFKNCNNRCYGCSFRNQVFPSYEQTCSSP